MIDTVVAEWENRDGRSIVSVQIESASMRLRAGEIHVWCLRPGEVQGTGAVQAALNLMSPDEVSRSNQFRFEKDRQRYLATRVLVRTVLSSYGPRPPQAWRFTLGPHGRPEIAGDNPLQLRFSVSKSDGLVVCGVVRGAAIGIDVESLTRTAPLPVAERFFAPAEIEALRSVPLADRPRRFYDYWTLKESYLKALGSGLSTALDSFAILMEPGHPPRLAFDVNSVDTGWAWQLTQVLPTDEHLVSICVGRSDPIDGNVLLRWQSLANLPGFVQQVRG